MTNDKYFFPMVAFWVAALVFLVASGISQSPGMADYNYTNTIQDEPQVDKMAKSRDQADEGSLNGRDYNWHRSNILQEFFKKEVTFETGIKKSTLFILFLSGGGAVLGLLFTFLYFFDFTPWVRYLKAKTQYWEAQRDISVKEAAEFKEYINKIGRDLETRR